jgi:hypothetical protein
MNKDTPNGIPKLLKWGGMGCVLVAGLAATATWKPGLYQRWMGRGQEEAAPGSAADRAKFATAKKGPTCASRSPRRASSAR